MTICDFLFFVYHITCTLCRDTGDSNNRMYSYSKVLVILHFDISYPGIGLSVGNLYSDSGKSAAWGLIQ